MRDGSSLFNERTSSVPRGKFHANMMLPLAEGCCDSIYQLPAGPERVTGVWGSVSNSKSPNATKMAECSWYHCAACCGKEATCFWVLRDVFIASGMWAKLWIRGVDHVRNTMMWSAKCILIVLFLIPDSCGEILATSNTSGQPGNLTTPHSWLLHPQMPLQQTRNYMNPICNAFWTPQWWWYILHYLLLLGIRDCSIILCFHRRLLSSLVRWVPSSLFFRSFLFAAFFGSFGGLKICRKRLVFNSKSMTRRQPGISWPIRLTPVEKKTIGKFVRGRWRSLLRTRAFSISA